MIELTKTDAHELFDRVLRHQQEYHGRKSKIKKFLGDEEGRKYAAALKRCGDCQGTIEDALVILACVRKIQKINKLGEKKND